jgi:hypothetical protein
VLPDNGTWRPKYVGAFDGRKVNNIGAFVGLFYITIECTVQELKCLSGVYSQIFQEVLGTTELDRDVVRM